MNEIMDVNSYIQQRLDDQITWYSNKSQWNQKCFKVLKIIEIGAAASIPFLVAYISDSNSLLKIISGILGLLVAVIAGILGLYQFQENWINYRTTAETLKHEKFLFLTKTEPYNIEEAFTLLVQRVESLISKENTSWLQYCKKDKGGENG